VRTKDEHYILSNNNRPEYVMLGGVLLLVVGLFMALDLGGRLTRLWDSIPVPPENGPKKNHDSN
jgi:hypothetical protein